MNGGAEPARQVHLTPVPLVPDDCPIVAVSPAMRRAVGLALRFAPTDLPILIMGPTGTGKELFARQIHHWSGRPAPFIDVNAGALPREMIESLLFGHRRGAFTGAVEAADGLVTAAGAGTLFLDELTSLPLEGQAKLLRVLESGEVRRLGDSINRPVLCRFVAAVQEDLESRIAEGHFRADLYQRLAGVVIRLPALAERREEVLPLARIFARERGGSLSPSAEAEFGGYDWPGNVRELKAAIQRAVHLSEDGLVTGEGAQEAIELCAPRRLRLSGPTGSSAGDPLIELCRTHGWDIGRAAEAVGVGRSTLYRKLRESGIDPARWREGARFTIRVEE
ncbi:MAG TPA: sigma 54-interacting transcriptional regulator [Gemmatimonadales bacterium]